ncbi:hypothetical protein PRK78_004483 [Emydomyces testavorans]|uniref:Fe2OG dioxygenase domain-containing protein n=1 Tax=Emydomyces testavorans TaxID=2070801 RepID=A0AAF0DLL6_9EURO|nr:hypothetical protein PRK78_004483 [Emydomyces testavorans]
MSESVWIKEKILGALDGIDIEGNFACFNSLPGTINPGLFVNHIGTIGLPLNSRDAAAIIEVCHRSPFGKGSQTLVDTSVRKCWELDANQFELQNPAWNQVMQSIMRTAIKELGVVRTGSRIKAEPYKFLLYEEGAFFLPHQDSPKADRMFGTLVVCLPSKHEGGEVVLTHDGQSRVFESSKTSAFGTSFAAWYSDVTHEIKPVKSGYRVVLTYNLIHDGAGAVPSAWAPNSKLESAFKFWKSCYDCEEGVPSFLLYKLSHQYPSSNFGFSSMKGKDTQLLAHLQSVCKKLGFQIYLGRVERKVWGGCDEYDDSYELEGNYHQIIEVCDDESGLKEVIDSDGVKILDHLDVNDLDCIQKNVISGIPDSEDYSGYTGNEGVSATHFYKKTVAVILPQSFRVAFRFNGMKPPSTGMSDWIEQLLQSLADPNDVESREEFRELSQLVIDYNSEVDKTNASQSSNRPGYYFQRRLAPFPDEILCKIAKGLSDIDEMTLCEVAIKQIRQRVTPMLSLCIAKLCCNRSFEEGMELLHAIGEKIKPEIGSYFTLVTGIVEACVAELHGSSDEEKATLQEWQRASIGDALTRVDSVQKDDGFYLAQIAELYPDKEILFNIKNVVTEFIDKIPFVSTFLASISESDPAKPGNEWTINLFRKILAKMDRDMKLEKIALRPKPPRRSSQAYRRGIRRPVPREYDSSKEQLNSDDLAAIVMQCRSLRVPAAPLYDGLKQSIAATTIERLEEVFNVLIFPFLRRLVDILSCNSDDAPASFNEECSQFIRDMLRLCMQYYVKDNSSLTNSSYSCSCSCSDCNQLNSFLRKPNLKSIQLLMSSCQRAHLYQAIELNRGKLEAEVIQDGRLKTMKITKTHIMPADWTKRVRQAAMMIESLGSSSGLEKVLGVKFCRALNEVISGERDSADLSTIWQGRKRPAARMSGGAVDRDGEVEVIDLT